VNVGPRRRRAHQRPDPAGRGQRADFAPDGPRLAAAPWQLDQPQPLIVELADKGEFGGPVRRYTTDMDPAALRDLVPEASMELAVDDGRGRSLLPIWHIAATRR
jgi:hypothetical protein